MGGVDSVLPLVLGPPDAWNSLAGSGAGVEGRGRRVRSTGVSQFAPLQTRFRCISACTHLLWSAAA